MGMLSFLKTAVVVEPVISRKNAAPSRLNPNPALLAVRVYASGAVYPSQALVEKFKLEYPNAIITKKSLPIKEGEEGGKTINSYSYPEGQNFGFDVFSSKDASQIRMDGNILMIMPVDRSQGKLDMFASTNYNDDGTPKTSVMTQGTITFGKGWLIEAIENTYGIVFSKKATEETEEVPGVDYVDMMVVDSLEENGENFNIVDQFSKEIFYVPKTISRGEDKGKQTVMRRENCKIYGFFPASLILPSVVESESDENANTSVSDAILA